MVAGGRFQGYRVFVKRGKVKKELQIFLEEQDYNNERIKTTEYTELHRDIKMNFLRETPCPQWLIKHIKYQLTFIFAETGFAAPFSTATGTGDASAAMIV